MVTELIGLIIERNFYFMLVIGSQKYLSIINISISKYLDFAAFRQWIQSDAAVTIIARLDNNIVEVPLNLYRLEIKK